jgi:hypothetical protein
MNRLRVLHLNIGKRPAVQQSLLNDDTLKDFDAMTVLEPYITEGRRRTHSRLHTRDRTELPPPSWNSYVGASVYGYHIDCRPHSWIQSGSNHKPIEIGVDINSAIDPPAQEKRLYKDADWGRIKRKILDRIGDGNVLSRIFDPSLLDIKASAFTNQVNTVLEKEVPKAKASLKDGERRS